MEFYEKYVVVVIAIVIISVLQVRKIGLKSRRLGLGWW